MLKIKELLNYAADDLRRQHPSSSRFPTLRRFCSDVPMIERGSLISMLQDFRTAEPPEWEEFRQYLTPPTYEAEPGVHVLPIYGALAMRPHPLELLMGVEDTERIQQQFQMLAEDPNVKAIVLDIDSPGGFSTGIPELADMVALVDKPVHAHTSGMMASAAYWIGSQADTISATRSALVGSIGVYTAFFDYTTMLEAAGIKVELFTNEGGVFKAAGHPGTSLTDEQRHEIQMRIDSTFDEFKSAVTEARPGIEDDSMRGQVFNGRQAVKAGLVDYEVSLEAALADLSRNVPTSIEVD